MRGIIGFFEGRAEIYADADNRESLISFLIDNNIRVKVRYCEKSCGVYTEIPTRLLKKIAPALDKSGIIVYIINIYGFKSTVNFMFKRPGIIFGALAFVAVLWISTLFVWRVEISGNEALTKDELKELLLSYGVSEGVKISELDERDVSARMTALCPEIAWAALNVQGTTVTLEVMETELSEDSPNQISDILVAKKGGVIREIEIYSGKAAVEAGTVVKEGDLLISGFISGNGLQYSETPGIRYEGADGRVRAEICEIADVFVPFETESRTEMRGKNVGVLLSVFGNDIFIGKDTGNEEPKVKRLSFFGEIELPVTYKVCYETSEVTEKKSISADEAALEAERLIYRKIIEMCGEGELVSVSIRYENTDNGVGAVAEITYITDIAVGKNIAK